MTGTSRNFGHMEIKNHHPTVEGKCWDIFVTSKVAIREKRAGVGKTVGSAKEGYRNPARGYSQVRDPIKAQTRKRNS